MPLNTRRTIRIKLSSKSANKYSTIIGKLLKPKMLLSKVTNSNSTDLLTGHKKNSRISSILNQFLINRSNRHWKAKGISLKIQVAYQLHQTLQIPHLLTGEIWVLLHLWKIKVNVVHAMLLHQPQLLKVSTKLKRDLWLIFQLSSLLIAHQIVPMEITGATVETWNTASTTINLTKLNHCLLILTLQFNNLANITKLLA